MEVELSDSSEYESEFEEEEEKEEECSEDHGKCRICWGTDNINNFISPCNCAGSSQFVHQSCLVKWIKTKFIASIPSVSSGRIEVRAVPCELCTGFYYVRVFPNTWPEYLLKVLMFGDIEVLKKIYRPLSWITVQSFTLALVSTSFVRQWRDMRLDQKMFGKIRNILSRLVSIIMNPSIIIERLRQMKDFMKRLLLDPLTTIILLIKHMISAIVSSFFEWLNRRINSVLNAMRNPVSLVREQLNHTLRLVLLYLRLFLLWILICQHSASVTISAAKIYRILREHKTKELELEVIDLASVIRELNLDQNQNNNNNDQQHNHNNNADHTYDQIIPLLHA